VWQAAGNESQSEHRILAGTAGFKIDTLLNSISFAPIRGPAMAQPTAKEEARRLLERLPDSATWDDIEYEIYVRRAIDAGLADSDAGAVDSVAEVRRSFGLPE
jgi:hypothetical protein